jgi:hypothetical protein
VARDGQRGSRLGGPFRGGPPQIAARRFTVTQHGWRRRPVLGGCLASCRGDPRVS